MAILNRLNSDCEMMIDDTMFHDRRKRAAADNDDDSDNDEASNKMMRSRRVYVKSGLITSDDDIEPPPDSALHQHAQFPTPTNISEEMADGLCRGSISTTELYERCLNLTTVDTEHYVRSCVDDIKV